MQRTGQDFPDGYVFREFPDGVREQHDQDSHHLRAVRVKLFSSNPDRNSSVIGKPVNPADTFEEEMVCQTTGWRDRVSR